MQERRRLSQMIWAHMSRSFAETFPIRASEWALALILLLWGLILVANPLALSSPALSALAEVMPQETWAIAFVVGGAARLIVLGINGAWRRSPHLRALGAFLSCFFWFQIAIGLMQADGLVVGLAVYPVLLFLDVYNAIRASRDAGFADRIHGRAARRGTDT